MPKHILTMPLVADSMYHFTLCSIFRCFPGGKLFRYFSAFGVKQAGVRQENRQEEMKYDKALVATGGSPRKLFVPGSDTLAMPRVELLGFFSFVRVEFFFVRMTRKGLNLK